ncbi:MAG: argininosuccinate synthase [Phycisphaerales bacterium]|nr:argininosuccinate synthase [Phycisphaerales bacterium]
MQRLTMPKKIALAYSGGLDTSCIVPWLRENIPGAEVVCVVGDVGQGSDELAGVEKKARDSGAAECHVVDLRAEFVDEFVLPTMIAGAIYEGRYLLGTAMARPVLARGQVSIAKKTGCTALAHGCTGKGNDQVRFESAYAALAPEMEIIAPWRHDRWNLSGRLAMLDYLKARNIPTTASATKIYSRDRNLWHISHEGGAIEDPWNPPPADAWMLTADPAAAPASPEDVTLSFQRGRPVALSVSTPPSGTGVPPVSTRPSSLPAWQIIEKLNSIAGPHGVGRVDLVENRRVGMKSRGLYETPGGTVLVEALRALEELVLDRETRHYREHLGLTFAELVYDGRWFTPLRQALWAAAEKMAEPLTGEVVVRLCRGTATAIQRKSPNSLYAEKMVSFEGEEVYSQKDAGGFIRLLSLPERIRAMKSRT